MENAVENPAVLSTIFKYLSVDELRSVRFVSKSWLQGSLPAWRKKTAVKILGDCISFERRDRGLLNKDYYYYKNQNIIIGTSSRRRFLREQVNQLYWAVAADTGKSGNGEAAPFQNFRIVLMRWKDDNLNILSSRFWQDCGPHIKHLEIMGSFNSYCAALRDILLGPTTPVLEIVVLRQLLDEETTGSSLNLSEMSSSSSYAQKPTVKFFEFVWRDNRYEGGNEGTQLPFTWEEVFTCFNNLEKLTIGCNAGKQVPDGTVLAPLMTLQTFRSTEKLGKLKHLDFARDFLFPEYYQEMLRFGRAMLKVLGETQIELQSLKLCFGWWQPVDIPEMEYYQLLEKQKDNLVTLDVGAMRTPEKGFLPPGPGIITFPKLETLTIQTLQNGIYPQMTGMELLRKCPNLKIFHILEASWFGMEMVGNPGIFGNLKELICPRFCSLKEIQLMGKMMPNLEVLQTPLDDSRLEAVCQNWTRLRRLTILNHYYSDLGGVTEAGFAGYYSNSGTAGGGSAIARGSLRDLKDLVYLKCEKMHVVRSVSLSQGIFLLPRLRHLEIYAELEDPQVEELFRRVPACVLYNKNGAATTATNEWKRLTNIWRE